MLYIRADMNDTIATGHVMRCLSIADAARRLGEETTFILADENGVPLLESRGYAYRVLHTDWRDCLGELPVLERLLETEGVKSLLIDSYQVTSEYLKRLSQLVKTIYLDDVDAFVYPVHAVLCYAVYAEWLQYPARYRQQEDTRDARFFLGPQYTPLRQCFCGRGEKQIAEQAGKLLLLSGGTDPYDILASLLERLVEREYEQITVICGRFYPRFHELCERYGGDTKVRLFQAVDNMQDYMEEADLAVSAGGSTLYELCALGTPAISYALADNQLGNVEGFRRLELIDYAGDVRKDPVAECIDELLERYRTDAALRQERSRRMQQLVDGKGAERIVQAWREL